MEIIPKEDMWQGESECYGCETLTMNASGMCDKCGSDSEPMKRKTHTLTEASQIIEGNN